MIACRSGCCIRRDRCIVHRHATGGIVMGNDETALRAPVDPDDPFGALVRELTDLDYTTRDSTDGVRTYGRADGGGIQAVNDRGDPQEARVSAVDDAGQAVWTMRLEPCSRCGRAARTPGARRGGVGHPAPLVCGYLRSGWGCARHPHRPDGSQLQGIPSSVRRRIVRDWAVRLSRRESTLRSTKVPDTAAPGWPVSGAPAAGYGGGGTNCCEVPRHPVGRIGKPVQVRHGPAAVTRELPPTRVTRSHWPSGWEGGRASVDLEVRRPASRPPAPNHRGMKRSGSLPMTNDLYDVIYRRRDVRGQFTGMPIPAEVLDRVLAAAHAAPSVGLSQPWDFIVVRDPAVREAFHRHVRDERDVFAATLDPDAAARFARIRIDGVMESTLSIVVTYDPQRGGPAVLGRHAIADAGLYSVCLAIGNLWLAATAEHLGVGWVSFYREPFLQHLLGIPAGIRPVAWLCLGPVTHLEAVPDLERHGWRQRRPLRAAVHADRWGTPRR